MGWLSLGNRITDGDYYRTTGTAQENVVNSDTDGDYFRQYGHDAEQSAPITTQSTTVNAAAGLGKQAAIGLVAGTVIGTTIISGILIKSNKLGFNSKMSKKKLAVRSSAVGAALSAPVILYVATKY